MSTDWELWYRDMVTHHQLTDIPGQPMRVITAHVEDLGRQVNKLTRERNEARATAIEDVVVAVGKRLAQMKGGSEHEEWNRAIDHVRHTIAPLLYRLLSSPTEREVCICRSFGYGEGHRESCPKHTELPEPCSECEGSGRVKTKSGDMGRHETETHTVKPCPKCGGSGEVNVGGSFDHGIINEPCDCQKEPCSKCGGSGEIEYPVQIGFTTIVNTKPCPDCQKEVSDETPRD